MIQKDFMPNSDEPGALDPRPRKWASYDAAFEGTAGSGLDIPSPAQIDAGHRELDAGW